MGDGCRLFHGLDGVLNLTQGSAFGSTLGFMLTPAPRALEKSFQNTLLKLITPSRNCANASLRRNTMDVSVASVSGRGAGESAWLKSRLVDTVVEFHGQGYQRLGGL